MLVNDYIKTFKACFDADEPMICLFYTFDEFQDFMESIGIEENKQPRVWENMVKNFNGFKDAENLMFGLIEQALEKESNEI